MTVISVFVLLKYIQIYILDILEIFLIFSQIRLNMKSLLMRGPNFNNLNSPQSIRLDVITRDVLTLSCVTITGGSGSIF